MIATKKPRPAVSIAGEIRPGDQFAVAPRTALRAFVTADRAEPDGPDHTAVGGKTELGAFRLRLRNGRAVYLIAAQE